MTKEMVEVLLYKDGTFELNNDIYGDVTTHKDYGFNKSQFCYMYYCRKDKWKMYLLKLINEYEKDIDKNLKQLNKRKEKLEKLKEKYSEVM